MNLIIHIGFPKCASTTLQNHIFRKESGYLGSYDGQPKGQNYAKQFQSCTPVGSRFQGNLIQANRWRQKVLQVATEKWPESRRLILSSESLSIRNQLQDRPVIGFLEKFSEKVWQEGVVKVLLILRHPADRIASQYAQASNTNPHASQEDFENYVDLQLRERSLVQYDMWVKELELALGTENVCVLMMEEIGEVSFWRQLKKFCQLKQFDPEEWLRQPQSSNIRKNDEESWILRSFDPDHRAKTRSNDIFNVFWPSHVLSQFRSVCVESSRTLLSRYFKARYGRGISERPNQIRLGPSLRAKVQKAYDPQFHGLSLRLGKSLKDLGY